MSAGLGQTPSFFNPTSELHDPKVTVDSTEHVLHGNETQFKQCINTDKGWILSAWNEQPTVYTWNPRSKLRNFYAYEALFPSPTVMVCHSSSRYDNLNDENKQITFMVIVTHHWGSIPGSGRVSPFIPNNGDNRRWWAVWSRMMGWHKNAFGVTLKQMKLGLIEFGLFKGWLSV